MGLGVWRKSNFCTVGAGDGDPGQEEDVAPVVPEADAVPDKGAVVVHPQDATPAHTAVVRPLRARPAARTTVQFGRPPPRVVAAVVPTVPLAARARATCPTSNGHVRAASDSWSLAAACEAALLGVAG